MRRILRKTNVDDSSCHAKCVQGLRHRRRPASRERGEPPTLPSLGMAGDAAEGRDLRCVQAEEPPMEKRRRIGGRAGWGTSRVAGPRNLRRVQAEEPPTYEASKDRRPSGGSKPPTSWSPRRGTHAEFEVWNYTIDLGSVDCNLRICWDIPPPSRDISVIVLGRFSSPI
jgi:hypothetical protein